MGEVLQFRRTTAHFLAEGEEAEPSGSLPAPEQSGQPAFLFLFPDGKVHLRTTTAGFAALTPVLSQGELPLTLASTAGGVTVEGTLTASPRRELLSLKRMLDPWLVVHAYGCEESGDGLSYRRRFHRLARSPLPAPGLHYLWTVDFGAHGGTWVFGTPRDLKAAREAVRGNDLVVFSEERTSPAGGDLECLALPSRHRDPFLAHLTREGFWLRREASWCDCH